MSDTAIENARRQRERLAMQINEAQQNLETWRRQIGRIEQFLTDYEAFAANTFPTEAVDKATSIQAFFVDGRQRMRAVGNSLKEEVAIAARRYIDRVGRPVPREELREKLRLQGLVVEGTDPYNVLNTMLFRTRDEFGVFLLRNVGYWLRERAWEPAGYAPGNDVSSEDDLNIGPPEFGPDHPDV